MRFFRFRPLLDKFGPKKPKQTGKKTKQKQKKKKKSQLSVQAEIWYLENQWRRSLCFRQRTLFLGKFGPKNQSRQLKTGI